MGWLQDQLRARFDIRGPIGEPIDIAPLVQVGMEARPSLPWEWGTARWFPVAGAINIGAGGAGTFASIGISVIAASLKAFVITSLSISVGGGAEVMLCVNQAFANPTQGVGLLDGRFLAAGSWLTPVTDAGLLAQNVAVAPPAVNTRIGYQYILPAEPYEWLNGHSGIVLLPGQTIAMFLGTANVGLWGSVTGYLVPVNDLT